MRLFHGGVPDLRVGDLILPGHNRTHHDGCPWCEARSKGEAYKGMDGPSQHADQVYATPERMYARFYASLFGRGDLYRVEPMGEMTVSEEDNIESYRANAFQVKAVLDRAVILTNSERRRLWREWGKADLLAAEKHV